MKPKVVKSGLLPVIILFPEMSIAPTTVAIPEDIIENNPLAKRFQNATQLLTITFFFDHTSLTYYLAYNAMGKSLGELNSKLKNRQV